VSPAFGLVPVLSGSFFSCTVNFGDQEFKYPVPGSHKIFFEKVKKIKPKLIKTEEKGQLSIDSGDVSSKRGSYIFNAWSTLFYNVPVNSGSWYYEMKILAPSGVAQVGWADSASAPTGGNGVGDDDHSWGADGIRVCKWNNGSDYWGSSWKAGDILGVCVNFTKKEIRFSLNGSFESPMGTAFTEIKFSDYLRAGMSASTNFACSLNFGEIPFENLPSGFEPLCNGVNVSLVLPQEEKQPLASSISTISGNSSSRNS